MRLAVRRSQDGVPSYVGITDSKKADKTADIATRTILHPKITDILLNDIKIFIKQKINSL